MKKKEYFICVPLFFLSLLLMFSCPPDNDPEPTESFTIIGYVLSFTDNESISGATVTCQDSSVLTNSEGYFSITVTPESDGDSIIVTSKGYAYYQRPLSAYTGNVTVEITLLPVDISKEIAPGNEGGNLIETADRASVSLPQLTGFTENLNVAITNYDVNTDELRCVPGDFSAIDEFGSETDIISQGMMDVTITGVDSGDEYSLEGLGTYDITIPITGDLSTAPGTISLWYFDRDLGKWIESGTLTKEDTLYTGTVTHFTTWNADTKFTNRTCISGTIDDPDFGGSYWISLSFPGFRREFYETENTFTIINLPQSTDMRIVITKTSTGAVWVKEFTTNNSAACYDLGTFPGPDYLFEVIGLEVSVDDEHIYLTWSEEPDDPDFQSVEISWVSIEGGIPETQTVIPGVLTATISGLTEGVYTVWIKTVFTGDEQSFGLKRIVKLGEWYDFELTLSVYYEDTYVDVSIDDTYYGTYDYNSDTLLLYLEANTKVTLEAFLAQDDELYGWYYSEVESSVENPINFYMTEDLYIGASFVLPY